MMENFLVVWLNSNADDIREEKKDLAMKLRPFIQIVKEFTDLDECVDFMTDTVTEKIFLIISGSTNYDFISHLNRISSLYGIYVLRNNVKELEFLLKECKAVKGIFSNIQSIREIIQKDARRLMIDSTSISIQSADSALNLNELDQSFMYTTLMKEIILNVKYDAEEAKKEFVQFCLTYSLVDDVEPEKFREFERSYESNSAIRWYTKEGFLYVPLNRALRMQDVEFLAQIGFFAQDLHRQIEEYHSKNPNQSTLILYRGQGLSKSDFEKLQKSKGGLLSFNCFLSTSLDRDVSYLLADSIQQTLDQTAILFIMEIDPSISSTPFARIDGISQFDEEAEILFSMHTVFRIGEMKQIDTRLWEVNLKLTADNDPQLKSLTDYLRKEINKADGWGQMSLLMMKMGKYEKSQEILDTWAETLGDGNLELVEILKNFLGNNTGMSEHFLGNYSAALANYEKCLRTLKEFRPWEYTCIAQVHNNMGFTYYSIGDFPAALRSYEKALESQRQSTPPDSLVLAKIYNNMALVRFSLGNLPDSLDLFKKALEIQQKSLPSGHPDLTVICNNIAAVHKLSGNYSLALLHMEKALEAEQKYLPQDHQDLAKGHNNIGAVYSCMCNYIPALIHYHKALEILQKSLSSSHPCLVELHNNLAVVYHLTGNSSSALTHLEEALRICRISLPSDHLNLAITYANIGEVQQAMGQYDIALVSLEKALTIRQKSLPSDHISFVEVYNAIAVLNHLTADYPNALSNCNKALAILQKSYPADHPELVRIYNNFGMIYQSMGDLSNALLYMKKTLEIQEKIHPMYESNSTITYNNIGDVYRQMGDYLLALSYYEKALEISQRLFPSNHSSFATVYNNIGATQQSLGNYSLALSFYQKTLEIQEEILPWNHPDIAQTRANIASVKVDRIPQEPFGSSHPLSASSHTSANPNNEAMENFRSVLSDKKSLSQTQQKFLPLLQPGADITDQNIAEVDQMMGQSSSMLSALEKLLRQQIRPDSGNSSSQSATQSNTTANNQILNNYLSMITNLQKSFQTSFNDDETTDNDDQFSAVVANYQKTLEMYHKQSPPNDVSLSTNYNNLGETCCACQGTSVTR